MLSDAMFEGVASVDETVAMIRHYLDSNTGGFTYVGHWSGELAEQIEPSWLHTREKMEALQLALDAELMPVKVVEKYGDPGVSAKLRSARESIESWTGETVPDGLPPFDAVEV